MNKIPRDIESWLQGYWTQKQGNFFFYAKEKALESFVVYHTCEKDERIAHELAHFIVCEDENIMDPTYGLNEFLFSEKMFFSISAHRTEIEVTVVEQYIKKYLLGGVFGEGGEYWRNQPITAGLVGSMTYFLCDKISREESENIAQEFILKWNIEKIWNELNRKYALVDAYLES